MNYVAKLMLQLYRQTFCVASKKGVKVL